MRQTVIAGNWKLHKTIRESVEFVELLKRSYVRQEGVSVVVCPVYTSISDVADTLEGTGIGVGGQDLFWESKGAFTGEVSANLLKDAGATHVIIGHSERRQFFGETDETVRKKTQAAFDAGLTPIVCCGELLEERESNKTNEVLNTQIRGAFEDLSEEVIRKCIIAYEPVWAIGTGKVATPAQAQEAHAFIRNLLRELIAEHADEISILYGGSVKPENAAELVSNPDVDGALVGGASLDADSFGKIIQAASEVNV